MSAATAYEVAARRWEHGWELHIPGVGVTQATTLDKADRQISDYLSTVFDLDRYEGDIRVIPEVEGITDTIRALQQIDVALAGLSIEKEGARERVTRAMLEQGFSYADIAGALGISKGRVSQLVNA